MCRLWVNSVTGAGVLNAERALGSGPEAAGRDRLAADVTASVAFLRKPVGPSPGRTLYSGRDHRLGHLGRGEGLTIAGTLGATEDQRAGPPDDRATEAGSLA